MTLDIRLERLEIVPRSYSMAIAGGHPAYHGFMLRDGYGTLSAINTIEEHDEPAPFVEEARGIARRHTPELRKQTSGSGAGSCLDRIRGLRFERCALSLKSSDDLVQHHAARTIV